MLIRLALTWWAADNKAGSNAENAAATALDEYWCCVGVVVVIFAARIAGRFTYGATRHGSSGVDTGGLWLDIKIPSSNLEKGKKLIFQSY